MFHYYYQNYLQSQVHRRKAGVGRVSYQLPFFKINGIHNWEFLASSLTIARKVSSNNSFYLFFYLFFLHKCDKNFLSQ